MLFISSYLLIHSHTRTWLIILILKNNTLFFSSLFALWYFFSLSLMECSTSYFPRFVSLIALNWPEFEPSSALCPPPGSPSPPATCRFSHSAQSCFAAEERRPTPSFAPETHDILELSVKKRETSKTEFRNKSNNLVYNVAVPFDAFIMDMKVINLVFILVHFNYFFPMLHDDMAEKKNKNWVCKLEFI